MERFVGVDASSTDGSLDILQANLPSNSTLLIADEGSLGLSLEVAVSQLPPARTDRDEWLWIIHDDSMPAPDALEHLAGAVEASESVSIAGCKLMDIDNPRRLVEVGLGVDRKAQRLTMIDVDEVDQGQYDGRSDYFAVSSAGMFIRREVFEELGGFDPALPGRGDDVDLCWRNRLAGHRVIVVPAAKMYHHVDVVDHLAGPREAKRSEVFQRLKFASGFALPFLWVSILLGGLGHLCASLLAKDPGHGFSYLGSTLRGLFSPVKLAASRRNVRSIRQVPRRQVRKLMTSGAAVREYRRNLNTGRVDSQVYGDGSGAEGPMEPSGENFSDFARIARPPRTSAVLALLLSLLLMAGVSLVNWRSLFGAMALSGGAARPLSNSLAEVGANAFSWFQLSGTGHGGAPDVIGALYWLYSAASFGHANLASLYLFFAVMPLAALAAWWGTGAVSRSRAVRFTAALLYALQPALVSALAAGRVGAILVHLVLPLLFLAVLRAMNAHVPVEGKVEPSLKQRRASAWTASACAALLLCVISAGSAAFFLLLVVLLYLLALSAPRRAATLWWVPLPAVVVNLPLLFSALGNPRVLFTDPGAPAAFTPAPIWQQALGFPESFDYHQLPMGFGFLPEGPWALVLALLAGAPVAVLALWGTISSAVSASENMRRNSRRLLWGAVLSLAAGWGVGFIPAALDSHQAVTAYTGPFISLSVFAMMAAAANAVAALRHENQPRELRPAGRKPLLSLASVLAVIAVLALGTVAITSSLQPAAADGQLARLAAAQQIAPAQPRTIPATAADAGRSDAMVRSLVLTAQASGEVDAKLVSGSGQTLDSLNRAAQASALSGSLLEPERNEASATDSVLRKAVAMLLSESSIDARESLRDLGVGYVVLDETGEFVSSTVRVLDAATGLASVGQTDTGWLWRVDYEDAKAGAGAGFARIVSEGQAPVILAASHGAIDQLDVEASDAPRTLVLATVADPQLRAEFNGKPLRTVGYPEQDSERWAQAWELPQEAGTLTVGYHQPFAPLYAVLCALVLLVTVLLALPVPSSRGLANYRNSEYRFREPAPAADAEAETAQEPTEDEAAQAEPVAAPVQPEPPLSRREARLRAEQLRQELAPKLSDRISDDEAEQEKK